MATIEIHDALKEALETEVAKSPDWFTFTVEELVTWAILQQLMECWFDRMKDSDAISLYKKLKRTIGQGDDIDYWESQFGQS